MNEKLMQTEGKHHYLIVERWSGIDARASYFQQAQAMRRLLDALEYIEKAYADDRVGLAAALAGQTGTVVLAVLDSPEDLGDFVKSNPANARISPADRTVLPMSDWDAGRSAFVKLIEEVQRLATDERRSELDGRVRPFVSERQDYPAHT